MFAGADDSCLDGLGPCAADERLNLLQDFALRSFRPDEYGREGNKNHETWSEGKDRVKGDGNTKPLRTVFVPSAPRDLDKPPQAIHALWA